MDVPNVLRVITISLGAVMIIMTLCVVVVYDYAVRVTDRPGTRFLPTHIVTIAASFIVFTAGGIAEMAGRFGQPVTWRLPLLTVAFILATIAQSAMFTVVRAQVREARRG